MSTLASTSTVGSGGGVVNLCAACRQPRDGDHLRDGHHPGCVPTLETLRVAWAAPGADQVGIEQAAARLAGGAA
jgi:hypothetical protein